MGFLRETRRLELKNKLVNEYSCPEDIAERATNIPNGQHDRYMWSHGQMCMKYGNGNAEHLFFKMSAAIMIAIGEEARDRKMGPNDFPHSYTFMENTTETHH